MECNDIRKILSAYIEGLVSADEKISIEKHLGPCDKCQKYLADLKSTMELVSNLEEIEPPPWLTQRVMARIRSDHESRRGILQKLLYPLYVKIPLAAIATIAIALTTIYIFKTNHPDVRTAKAPPETSRKSLTQEISGPQKKIPGGEEKISKEKQTIPKERETIVRHERPSKDLGALPRERSTIGNKDTSFGFAAASDEARFFLIGSVYSEAMAYLQEGEMDLAAERLQLIEKELTALNVPGPLLDSINKTRNLIEKKRYSKEALIDIMSLFQPSFEEYAKNKSEDKLTLFRAGSWLMDMSLATAAGNRELLKQTVKLNYFIKEMKRMDAPKGVLTALDEIEKIANKTDITDKDTKKVLDLIKEIQTILG
jgi:hypothetical protein